MSKKPYSNGWLPTSQAAAALQNQADTIFDELNASIDRNRAFKARFAAREAEKRRSAEAAKALHQINDDFCAKMQAIDLHYAKLEKALRGAEAQKAVDDAAFASAMLFAGMTPGPTSLRVAGEGLKAGAYKFDGRVFWADDSEARADAWNKRWASRA